MDEAKEQSKPKKEWKKGGGERLGQITSQTRMQEASKGLSSVFSLVLLPGELASHKTVQTHGKWQRQSR